MPTAPLFDRDTRAGDRAYAASRDTAMAAGRRLVTQRLIRRALVKPGSIPLHPDFGCGLGDLVEEIVDDTLTARIRGRVEAQFVRDPAVTSVDDVRVSSSVSNTLLVEVRVTLTADSSQLVVPVSIH